MTFEPIPVDDQDDDADGLTDDDEDLLVMMMISGSTQVHRVQRAPRVSHE